MLLRHATFVLWAARSPFEQSVAAEIVIARRLCADPVRARAPTVLIGKPLELDDPHENVA
jgi:hypothetical protein